MTEFVSYVSDILGSPPAGCESLEYIVAGCLLVMLCMSCITFVSGLFKWIGGL